MNVIDFGIYHVIHSSDGWKFHRFLQIQFELDDLQDKILPSFFFFVFLKDFLPSSTRVTTSEMAKSESALATAWAPNVVNILPTKPT